MSLVVPWGTWGKYPVDGRVGETGRQNKVTQPSCVLICMHGLIFSPSLIRPATLIALSHQIHYKFIWQVVMSYFVWYWVAALPREVCYITMLYMPWEAIASTQPSTVCLDGKIRPGLHITGTHCYSKPLCALVPVLLCCGHRSHHSYSPNHACCSPCTSIAKPKSASFTAAPLALLASSKFSGWKK